MPPTTPPSEPDLHADNLVSFVKEATLVGEGMLFGIRVEYCAHTAYYDDTRHEYAPHRDSFYTVYEFRGEPRIGQRNGQCQLEREAIPVTYRRRARIRMRYIERWTHNVTLQAWYDWWTGEDTAYLSAAAVVLGRAAQSVSLSSLLSRMGLERYIITGKLATWLSPAAAAAAVDLGPAAAGMCLAEALVVAGAVTADFLTFFILGTWISRAYITPAWTLEWSGWVIDETDMFQGQLFSTFPSALEFETAEVILRENPVWVPLGVPIPCPRSPETPPESTETGEATEDLNELAPTATAPRRFEESAAVIRTVTAELPDLGAELEQLRTVSDLRRVAKSMTPLERRRLAVRAGFRR